MVRKKRERGKPNSGGREKEGKPCPLNVKEKREPTFWFYGLGKRYALRGRGEEPLYTNKHMRRRKGKELTCPFVERGAYFLILRQNWNWGCRRRRGRKGERRIRRSLVNVEP